MTSLQNIVILGAQGFLMLMIPKFYIMMTRPQNIKWPRPGHLHQQFCSHQYQEAWAPERTMFCSEIIITKTFKQAALAAYFDFTSFSTRRFSIWPLLFKSTHLLRSDDLDLIWISLLKLFCFSGAILEALVLLVD